MSHPISPPPQRFDRWLLAALLLGLLVRGSMLWQYRDTLTRDDDNYGEIASNLRQQFVFGLGQDPVVPTAFRPPLYPLLLAATMVQQTITPLQVAQLHLLLALATMILIYQLARQYQLGRAAPWAVLLFACDPVLMYQSTRIMTETLATLMAVATLYGFSRLQHRRHWSTALGCGFLIGLSILCRPTFLVWLVLILLAVALLESHWRQRLQLGTALLLGAILTITPWTVRNLVQFQKPIALTTHGGYTLLLGNNPVFYDHLRNQPPGTVWKTAEVNRFKQGLKKMAPYDDPDKDYWSTDVTHNTNQSVSTATEYEADRFAYRVARHQISQQPGMFIWSSLIRVGRLWSPLPHQINPNESGGSRGLRYLTAGWYGALYLLALTGLFRLRLTLLREPWVWGLLLVVTLTAVHALFWSNIRMRAPLIPWLNLLAAAEVLRWWPGGSRITPAEDSTEASVKDPKV
jgi:4-amino-4-deoxy-L-arabinose transferase-like glycosyltransferase